ncbi:MULTISPECIES: hypothetical protein [unclassified Modestobacter]
MARSSRRAQLLIGVSLVAVLGLAGWAWGAGGPAVLLVFGPAVAGALLALAAERASRTMMAPAVTAGVGAASLVWGLVTLAGGGLHLLVPAGLLVVAALVSWVDRRPRARARART